MKQNDYSFGEKLFRYRKAAGLTQVQLADQLGIGSKAVSKWENGAAKPTTDVLRKLATLYGVSVESLLAERDEPNRSQSISKIVLTGWSVRRQDDGDELDSEQSAQMRL